MEDKMNYRTLFLLNSFFAFLLGALFLVVPALAIGQFGVDSYTSTRLMAQLFGAAMLALGLLLWFVKDVASEAMQRGMAIAMLVGALAGLFVTVLGAFTGTMRTNGWMAILAYVLFGLGYALLLFLRREARQ
jgi:drug/metabolite transporter (DMT)-like permease